uniref:F-box domain-containing protein n=1 Tax=Oryza punctata TaxID=4537 RepID=A0A0E0LM21_ORYPU
MGVIRIEIDLRSVPSPDPVPSVRKQMALPQSKRKRQGGAIRTARARKRARGCNAQYGGTCQDRISELPDHLLATILSHLDTRSSAATSVLSQRWKHIWKSVPTLRFSQDDALPPRKMQSFLRAHKYIFFKAIIVPMVTTGATTLLKLVDRYETHIFSNSLTGFIRKSINSDMNSTKFSSLVLCCTIFREYARGAFFH